MRQLARACAKSKNRRSFFLILFAAGLPTTSDLTAEARTRLTSRGVGETYRPARQRELEGAMERLRELQPPVERGRDVLDPRPDVQPRLRELRMHRPHDGQRGLGFRTAGRDVRDARLSLTTDILEDDLLRQDREAPAVDRMNRGLKKTVRPAKT